jgi:RNA polymerase subunit RPABC4/transcription elongation factor Spt4
MSHLSDELRIIRRGGWLATILVYLLLVAAATMVTQFEGDVTTWPLAGRLAFVIGLPLLPAIYVLLVAYVYADARRREMRYVMWTLLAFFVPYAIGIIVYFIMRDPLPEPCPKCGAMTPYAFTFCPQCGAVTKPSCPQCHRALQRGWTHCPTCGAAV